LRLGDPHPGRSPFDAPHLNLTAALGYNGLGVPLPLRNHGGKGGVGGGGLWGGGVALADASCLPPAAKR
jgi:hypothetical protein